MNTDWPRLVRILCAVVLAAFVSACTIVTAPDPRPKDDEDASTFNANLGLKYLERGNLDLANEKLTKALEQDDKNPLAHISMAQLQFAIDKPDVARRHYRRAVSLDPDNADNRNAYGVFLCSTGELEAAEKEFVTAASNPFYATPEFALDNAGLCLLDNDRLEDSEYYFLKALQRNPKFGNATLHIAELRYLENRLTIADAFLSRFHDVSEETAASLWLGAQIQRSLNNRAGADAYAKRLLNLFPNSTEAGAYLAQPN